MIHFDVTTNDGDRELRVEGRTEIHGWIERGRSMVDGNGNPWVEWRFTPAQGEQTYPVRRTISDAYGDARAHAATN